jgi:hypothetical protein
MAPFKAFAAAACILALQASSAFAHDEFRYVGVITKINKTSLQMKAREGKSVNVRLDGQTFINKDKKKLEPASLKAGDTVVVDALGDSEADLQALEVRVVPAIK